MSHNLDEVSNKGYSNPIDNTFTAKKAECNPQLENNSLLSIKRSSPGNSSSCQEVADSRFNSINEAYTQAKIVYTDTAMKGRGSKRLDGFPIILWNLSAFIKWVKAEAERVKFEVTITRRNEYHKNQWSQAKQAFQAELDRINLQRQAKP